MWLIAIPAALLLLFVSAYLYWRFFLRPYLPYPLRCYLIHDVDPKPSFLSVSGISLDLFKLFIQEAKDADMKFVTPERFISHKSRNEILLTFDDGFESMFRHVFPLLKEQNIPALLFIPGSYVGKRPSWDYHVSGRKHLTEDQLDKMEQSGLITIGSHSATHPDLTKVSVDRLAKEVKRSSVDSQRYFSYPFGRFNPTVIDAVEDTGYMGCFCSLNGRPSLWQERNVIPRIPLNRFENRFTFRMKLRQGSLFWCEFVKARIIGIFAPFTYDWRGRP